MKATEIKNKALADIKSVLDIAIETAEKSAAFDYPLSKHIERREAKTPNKKEDAICEYLRYSGASEILDENISLQYDLFECNFPVIHSIYLQRRVKNGFGNGKSKQPTKNTPSVLNKRSKDMQTYISELRDDYHGLFYLTKEQNESRKKEVLKAYKKSSKGDIIRECWKWIVSEKNIEGIHKPYLVEPKAIFTPYKDCIKVDSNGKVKNVA